MNDETIVAEINSAASAALRVIGRAAHGRLGGAIYVEWPDGRRSVVTRFLGSRDAAQQTAETLSYVRDRGVLVARHELVVDLGHSVYFVQERLPSAPSRLTNARIDAIVAINDTFAGVLAARPDVPAPPMAVSMMDGLGECHLAAHGARGRRIFEAIMRAAALAPDIVTTGPDLLHTDLNAANVLCDANDRATAVVDWNLGVHRGDRWFGLVNTRFDREWFVRSPDADPVESRAAAYLDEILTAKIAPDTLRAYWAIWLSHHLARTIRSGPQEALAWQLDLAESRLL